MDGTKFLLPDFALRLEVSKVRKSNEKDMKALDNVGCITQDVAEIKLLIHNLPKIKVNGSVPENFNSQISSSQVMSYGSSALHSENSQHTSEQIQQNLLIQIF